MHMLNQEVCLEIVISLGHFLWQGTLLAGIAAVALRWLKTPRSRYVALVATFTLMAVCPVVTFTLPWLKLKQTPAVVAVPVPVSPDVAIAGPHLPAAPPTTAAVELSLPAESLGQTAAMLPATDPTMTIAEGVTGSAAQAILPEPAMNLKSPWLISVILATYLLGVAIMVLRLAAGLWGGWKLRKQSAPIFALELREAIERQARLLGLKFVPVMAYCERVAVPTVIGVLKPTVLLPASLVSGLTMDQIEAILAHELAHIRRYDHLINLVQRVIESLLFFHPAVWWISHRIRVEREHCCDDLAIASGAVPLEYAASLLKVAELSRLSGLRAVPAVGLSATGRISTLRQRISRLLGDPAAPQMRLAHSLSVFALGAASCLLAWVATSFFWEKLAAAKEPQPQSPVMVLWTAAVNDDVLDELRWLHLSKNRPVEAAARMALKKPISVNIIDNSLEEVVALLRKQYGISIRIDAGALRDAGINSAVRDQNFQLSDIQLASVLQLMLTPKKLGYLLDETGITITTSEKAMVVADLQTAPKAAKLAAARPENELERLFCSAEELRKVINRVRRDPLEVKVGSYIHSFSPRPKPFPEDHWHTSHSDNLFFVDRWTPLNWSGNGALTLMPDAMEPTLEFKGYMTFEVGRESTMKRVDFDVKERLKPSEVVAYVIPSPSKNGWRPSLLVMCEMLTVPTSDLKLARQLISQQNFVQLGPTELKERAARAVAWKARNHRNLSELNPKWTRDLPHGGHLQLVAISRPKRAPLIWWTPDGEPIGGISINCISDQEMIAIVRVWEDGQRRTRALPPNTTEGWIPDYESEDRKANNDLTIRLGSQLEMLPAQLVGPAGEPVVKIGLGTGPWTAEAKLSAVRDSTVKFQGSNFRMASVHSFPPTFQKQPQSAGAFYWDPTHDFDFTFVAVNKSGEQFPSYTPPIVVGNEPKNTFNRGEPFYHSVKGSEVDHYLIKSRTAQWVEFKGFATRPTIPLPNLAAQQALTAKLPTGLVVELAGVTKNTARAQSGWRPDGQPVAEIAEWPAGSTVSGNRITATIDPRKYPPDPDVVDFLVQFSEIREPFSFKFIAPEINSYQLPALKGVVKIRVSGRDRKEKFQTRFSMVMTDEPWGKYQRVAGDGTLLNLIEKADLYAGYYRSIRVVKAGETKQPDHLPTAPQIIFRRKKDWGNDYNFEIRAIDKRGKPHYVMMWLERYAQGLDLPESFWRADQELLPQDFSHFEFRLRPYRHLVTFENVALSSGHPTQARVTVQAIEDTSSEDQSVTNKRIIPWLRALADGTTNEKAQAAAEIARWAEETRPATINPRLLKALVKRIDSEDAGTAGDPQRGRVTKTLRQWIRDAFKQIGRPAATELIAVVNGDSDTRRSAAVDAMGELSSIGPEGVDTLIGLLGDRGPDLANRAAYSLEHAAAEPTLIPKLIAASEKGDLTTRSRAIGILGNFEGDAVDAVLRKALADPEQQIKLWGLHALDRRPRPQLAPLLVGLLDSNSSDMREKARRLLTRDAGSAVDALLSGMKSSNPKIRIACFYASIQMFEDEAERFVPVIAESLNDANPDVRSAAMNLAGSHLIHFKHLPIPDLVLAQIQDPNPKVRHAAVSLARQTLRIFGRDPRLVPQLLKALNEKDTLLWIRTVELLGAYQETQAVPSLIKYAESLHSKASRREGIFPILTAQTFAAIGDARAIPVLKKMALDGHSEAVIALASFKDPQTVPFLLELFSTADNEMRTAAARAFEIFPDPRATPVLMGLLSGADLEGGPIHYSNVRRAVAGALTHSNDPQAIAAVISHISEVPQGNRLRDESVISEEAVNSLIPEHPYTSPLIAAGRGACAELAKGLSSKSLSTRRVCAYVLSQSYRQDEPIPNDSPAFRSALITALKDPDPHVVKWIVDTVGHLRIVEAEPILIEMLDDRQVGGSTKGRILNAFITFKSDALYRTLLRIAQDRDSPYRQQAIERLVNYPGENTVMVFMKALNEGIADAPAAVALGRQGIRRAIPQLRQVLISRIDVRAQAGAAEALGLLGAKEVRADLRNVLARVSANEAEQPAYELQLAAAISLVQLEDDAGTERLRQLLTIRNKRLWMVSSQLHWANYISRNREFGKLTHPPFRALLRELIEAGTAATFTLRTEMLQILGSQLDEPTTKFVERLALDPKSDLQRTAVSILVEKDPQRFAEPLRKLLQNRDTWDRRQLVPLLSRIPDRESALQLVALTADPDLEVRVAAVRAMEKRYEVDVISRLKELANDPNPRIKAMAIRILSLRQIPVPK